MDGIEPWNREGIRRNLSAYERTKLALRLEEAIAGRAKERQQGGQGGVLLLQKSAEAIDTRQEIAKAAGVSHDTVGSFKRAFKHPFKHPGRQSLVSC